MRITFRPEVAAVRSTPRTMATPLCVRGIRAGAVARGFAQCASSANAARPAAAAAAAGGQATMDQRTDLSRRQPGSSLCLPLIPRQLAGHLGNGGQRHILEIESSSVEGAAVGHKLRVGRVDGRGAGIDAGGREGGLGTAQKCSCKPCVHSKLEMAKSSEAMEWQLRGQHKRQRGKVGRHQQGPTTAGQSGQRFGSRLAAYAMKQHCSGMKRQAGTVHMHSPPTSTRGKKQHSRCRPAPSPACPAP